MSKVLGGIAMLMVVGLAVGSARLLLAGEPGEGILVGDVDCDGSVDAVDALNVLRYDADMGTNQPPGCSALGDGGHPVASAINDLALRLGVDLDAIIVSEVRGGQVG